MYIEFRTTVENPLFLLGHILHGVEKEVAFWAQANGIEYTSKQHKKTFRVGFNDEKHFTIFRLTWKDLPYTEYKIIDNKW